MVDFKLESYDVNVMIESHRKVDIMGVSSYKLLEFHFKGKDMCRFTHCNNQLILARGLALEFPIANAFTC